MGQDEAKWAAARRAVEYVAPGMVVGLGTGSTATKFVELLARRARDEGLDIRGVPTSAATRAKALEWGIGLSDEGSDFGPIDLTVDGADEVDPRGHMIKGGGGALLFEKLVAVASAKVLILVDETKHVSELGHSFRLPVEILPFGWSRTLERLAAEGAVGELRRSRGSVLMTDGGHYIADCRFDGIPDPSDLHRRLKMLPGVVETGLFIGIADLLVTGRADGTVRETVVGAGRVTPRGPSG